MAKSAVLTAEELSGLNLPTKRTELVRGALVVREPPGYLHGYVVLKLAVELGVHARMHGLGHVLAAETGFKLFANPDTVRAPDIAFVRRERVPDPLPRGYAAMAPDLVVEVLAPDDRSGKVAEKVADWLRAGTALVWVIDPAKHTARVHRADGSADEVGIDGALMGESVLPGFVCELASVV